MNEFQRSIVKVLSKRQQSNQHEESDEDKLFLLSFLPTLKNMPISEKYDFKMQMLQVLKNIQCANKPNYSYTQLTNNVMSHIPVQYQYNIPPTNNNIINKYQYPFIPPSSHYQGTVPNNVSNLNDSFSSNISSPKSTVYQTTITPSTTTDPIQNQPRKSCNFNLNDSFLSDISSPNTNTVYQSTVPNTTPNPIHLSTSIFD